MKKIAFSALYKRARVLFVLFFLGFSGCSLPRQASAPVVFDFGPGTRQPAPALRLAPLPPLEVSAPRASTALAGQAVLYRLAYADAQALKAYTLARWSMPPAQLIDLRLRGHLGLRRAVVGTGELLQTTPQSTEAPPPLNLRLELEEFSQVFDTPEQSSGLLRLRATLTRRGARGDSLLAQRSFVVQQPATSADAAGGARALAAAADQAIVEIEQWVDQVQAAVRAP